MTKINQGQAARAEIANIDFKLTELHEQRNAAISEQIEARSRYAKGDLSQAAFDAIQARIDKLDASIRALRDWRPDLETQVRDAAKKQSIESFIETR